MLTSVTSIVVVVLAARHLAVADFGRFALVYTLTVLVVGVVRAYIVEPQLVAIPAHEVARRRAALSSGLRFWGRLIPLAVVLVLVAVALPDLSELPRALLAAVALVVCMGLTDSARFRLAGSGRVPTALTINACVLATAITLILLLSPDSYAAVLELMALSYGAIGLVASGGQLIDSAERRAAREAAHDARRDPRIRVLARNYAAEFAVGNGGYYMASVVGSSLVGLHAAAGIRGSESLLGPVRVLIVVLPNALLATSTFQYGQRRAAAVVSLVLSLFAVAFYGAALGLFSLVGDHLYGESADAVGDMLPYIALTPVFLAVSTGPVVTLRYLGRSEVSVRIRTVASVLPVLGALVGSTWGTRGVASGLAVASACAAVLWWVAITRLVPAPAAESDAEAQPRG